MSIILVFLSSNTHATRYSKQDFMQQYQTSLITDFPEEVSNRQVINKWCQALLNTQIPNEKKAQLSGFIYSWAYIAPTQSILAYLICKWYDKNAYKSFDKQLIAAIQQPIYNKLILDLDTKSCDFTSSKNNLNDCDVVQLVNDLTITILNDMTNIRHATAWWYLSLTPKDTAFYISQHFAHATGKNLVDTINQTNKALCNNPGTQYIGETPSGWCGFTRTNSELIQDRLKWEQIMKTSVALDGKKLLLYGCDNPDDGNNIIWCGINNHTTTQPFASMLYNELRVYDQFMTMYRGIASVNAGLIRGNKQWISQDQYQSLLSTLNNNIDTERKRISNATQVSINLISQFEANYYIHIGMRAAIEIGQQSIAALQQRSTNSNNYITRLQNTQKKS